MSYNAIVGKIFVKPHPNADKIQIGSIFNENVIVGLDIKNEQMMMFFPSDGQLSEQFAKSNNLLKEQGGYFDNNRRVRVQTFRGEKSEGFACSLNFLFNCGVSQKTIDNLKIGDQFCELDRIQICNKYVTEKTKRNLNKNKSIITKKKNIRFPEHFETKHLKYEIDYIPINSILYISEKIHGTSHRVAYVQEEVENSLIKRFLGHPKTILRWKYQIGSRRVVLDNSNLDNKGFYGTNEFRYKISNPIFFNSNLKKGEVVFGEIVGYVSENFPIMPSVSTQKIKNKEIEKQYGKTMEYKYGCINGECKFYVYRITMINEDGDIFDLPWQQVKKRCEQLNLKYVSELIQDPIIYDGNSEKLLNLVTSLTEGSSTLDPSHIREGVVVRIEHDRGIYCIKEKSYTFKVLEGIVKDDDNYSDIEEEQG